MDNEYITDEHHLPDAREIQKLLQVKKTPLINFKGDVHFQGEQGGYPGSLASTMGLCGQRTLQTHSLPCTFIRIMKSIQTRFSKLHKLDPDEI